MHQIICKSLQRKIVPVREEKIALLNKLLDSYESLDKTFKLTIEVIEKNINEHQQSLYRAFIIKASNHFGNTYQEMESILGRFRPVVSSSGGVKAFYKPVPSWNSKELDRFINQASVLLAEQGFIF